MPLICFIFNIPLLEKELFLQIQQTEQKSCVHLPSFTSPRLSVHAAILAPAWVWLPNSVASLIHYFILLSMWRLLPSVSLNLNPKHSLLLSLFALSHPIFRLWICMHVFLCIFWFYHHQKTQVLIFHQCFWLPLSVWLTCGNLQSLNSWGADRSTLSMRIGWLNVAGFWPMQAWPSHIGIQFIGSELFWGLGFYSCDQGMREWRRF